MTWAHVGAFVAGVWVGVLLAVRAFAIDRFQRKPRGVTLDFSGQTIELSKPIRIYDQGNGAGLAGARFVPFAGGDDGGRDAA